jgi:hypothetical protein
MDQIRILNKLPYRYSANSSRPHRPNAIAYMTNRSCLFCPFVCLYLSAYILVSHMGSRSRWTETETIDRKQASPTSRSNWVVYGAVQKLLSLVIGDQNGPAVPKMLFTII